MTTLKLWPDAQETLLLRAALRNDDTALADFAAWQRGIDWAGHIDGGSFRMLPLVHANLARLGCTDPAMGRLAGVYRYSWCEAQTHLRRGAKAIDLLRRQGIPVMISKGLALAVAYYDSPAHRPMSDIDLVVPVDRAIEALALLNAGGWQETAADRRQWAGRKADMLALTVGMGLYHDRDGEIDLHWRLLHESGRAALENRFWQQARPITIAGVEALRPCGDHLLLHVIIHGLRPNVMAPMRWVADAAMILKRDAGTIDWDEILRCARQMRVNRRLDSGLAFLRDHMGLAIPAGVATGAVSPGWIERIEDRAFQASTREPSPARQESLQFRAYLVRFLASDGVRHLPRLTLRWLARRLLPARLVT